MAKKIVAKKAVMRRAFLNAKRILRKTVEHNSSKAWALACDGGSEQESSADIAGENSPQRESFTWVRDSNGGGDRPDICALCAFRRADGYRICRKTFRSQSLLQPNRWDPRAAIHRGLRARSQGRQDRENREPAHRQWAFRWRLRGLQFGRASISRRGRFRHSRAREIFR